MTSMWLIAGFALWIVPVLAYRYARRHSLSHIYFRTGIALGAVASPAALGTYSLYFLAGTIGVMALPLAAVGIVGLVLAMFHGVPGYDLAIMLGLVRPAEVVHGIQSVYIECLNSVIWAGAYGAVGYTLDSVIGWQRTRN
jgi:hypothetical protein